MASPLGCPRCGFQNTAGYQFCVNCGAPLGTAGAAAPRASPYPAPGAFAPYAPPADYERPKRIERTKTGILLLLFGTLLGWLPVISIVGDLLILVGVFLVILGRRSFGPVHSRNVVWSVVLFIVGLLVVGLVAFVVTLSNIGSVIGPGGTVNITPAFLASAANAGLLAAIVAAVILGVAEILFTYALQQQTGRILLWAAYGANLALAFALYLILSPQFAAVATQADYDRAAAAQQMYALLTVVPALLFAGADYLAWSRINRGEIPMPEPTAVGPSETPPSGSAPPINPR